MTRTDDGAVSVALRSLRVLVMIYVALDIGLSLVVRSTGDQASVTAAYVGRSLLGAAAIAAVLWCRTGWAVLLTAAALVAAVGLGPTGVEVALQLAVAVVAGATARRRPLALVCAAMTAYVLAFAAYLEHRVPGWGRPALITDLALLGAGLLVGLAARSLLRRDRRRQHRLSELRAENVIIAAQERHRLADDLQSVVSHGLDELRSEVQRISDASPAHQRLGLARIDVRCRAVLDELRALLEVLRRDQVAPATDRRGQSRSVLVGARGRRWATAALLTSVAVLGYAVLARDATGWDGIAVGLLGLIGAARFGTRRLWAVVAVLSAYGVARWLLGIGSGSSLALVVIGGMVGLLLGMTIHHFRQSRAAAERRLEALLGERAQVGPEARSAVARELHDVVAHQLSVITMLVMAGGLSEDPDVLSRTAARVRHSTEAAHAELDALLHAVRGSAADGARPSPLASPVGTVTALSLRLTEQGFRPVVVVDPLAAELDHTAQRTLSRILQEATTNILRYAAPGSSCRYELRVHPDQVQLRVDSPLAGEDRDGRRLSLGWGLRGIRERVELCGGDFSAGPHGGEWRLVVSLPRRPASSPVRTRAEDVTVAAA